MPLVNLNSILPQARKKKQAVAAFNVANLETLYPAVKAAESESSPVIIQIYHRLFADDRAGLIAAMAIKSAENSKIPIVLQLDHGTCIEDIRRAIKTGCSSVMIDCSMLSFEENLSLTSEAVNLAQKAGITVEAEIGHVPFGDGEVKLSTPEEACKFARETGVDALAVSLGTAHGIYKKKPVIDMSRAREISRQVKAPLVIHGGSGVPTAQLRTLIELGITKINIATEYQDLFIRKFAKEAEKNGGAFYPVDIYLSPVEEILFAYARKKIRDFALKNSCKV